MFKLFWNLKSFMISIIDKPKEIQYKIILKQFFICSLFWRLQEQYIFVHDALLEKFVSENTLITCSEFPERLKQLLQNHDTGQFYGQL